VVISDGITPFTKYLVYLTVKVSSDNRKATSDTVGPVYVTTNQGGNSVKNFIGIPPPQGGYPTDFIRGCSA